MGIFSTNAFASDDDDAIHVSGINDTTYLSIFNTGTFSDVSITKWYYYYVQDISQRGIIYGDSNNTFGPDNNLTRAEAVTILSRSFAGSLGSTSNTPFNDISGHWARNAIVWAYNMGIVGGTGNGNFSPDSYVTRQDFAVMIVRYCINAEIFTLPTITAKTTFADDATIASYAKDSVYKLQKATIIAGAGSYKFYPYSYITRAEVSKIISKTIGLISADGVAISREETDSVRGFLLLVPTAYVVTSQFYQEYREASNYITFYQTYSTLVVSKQVRQLFDVYLKPVGFYNASDLKRGTTLIASRNLNVIMSSLYNGDLYLFDGRCCKIAFKDTAGGTYHALLSSKVALGSDEGKNGILSFTYDIAISH